VTAAPGLVPAFPRGPRERVQLRRLGMTISLPDAGGWAVTPGRSQFVPLEHAATGSRLLVSLWLEGENMTPASCEERARLWRELPTRARALGSRRLEVPPGFDTRSDAGLSEVGPAPAAGYLLAFGARQRRCFALVFTTTATGIDADDVITDRLITIEAGTLATVGLDAPLDPDHIRERRAGERP
jgi:hypothetical protein